MNSANIFQQLEKHSSPGDLSAALDILSEHLRQEKRFAELFEARKMQARHRVGLPILANRPWASKQDEELNEAKQLELEKQLFDGCREIGTLQVEEGHIADGWVYLEALGDKKYSQSLIESVPVTEENSQEIIDIALGRGAAPAFGFKLLIDEHGTCNAITTFDSFAMQLPPADQRQLASTLLNHVYQQLHENIVNHLQESTGSKNASTSTSSIRTLVAGHDEIFADGGHHMDATHIASTVRISRILEDPDSLNKALEICEYGKRLSKDLQFPDSPPFENIYVDHEILFRALLEAETDSADKDCLLYTSPSPRDQRGSRMPSSA